MKNLCFQCSSVCVRDVDLEEEGQRHTHGIRSEVLQKNEEVRRRTRRKQNIVQTVMKRKLNLFGHICRMDDGRMVKTVVFGMMEGTNRKGRPRREWLDDITEWCKKGIQEVAGIAKDRETWKHLVEDALDTNGQCAHG